MTAKKSNTVKDDYVKKVGDTEVRLPSLSYLKPGLIRKIRRLSDIDAMYTLLELVLEKDALAVLDDMDPDEYAALLDGWREHSGVSLGE
ncbi:hypothetical protein SAMN04244553_3588 [Nocardia amikacinitolerans]|uniref:Phage tail assembly chaperone protein, E, or 41 or 14 n=1 Tax=Nocardia amikacinitolerans TaxID=756689 RepID=A0A285LGD3_9NOCA|nr:hypothetical protein [Nocardia amikacinitolerans]SNY84018.1 hypothetical protein SAMN04244553_3588 [Nocardia amikacinitolerans]